MLYLIYNLEPRKIENQIQHRHEITEMLAASLNFWLTKFVGEVVNKNGGRYPLKTLYQIVCGVSRHIGCHVENGINVLNKSDQR